MKSIRNWDEDDWKEWRDLKEGRHREVALGPKDDRREDVK